jgi:protein pelota
LILNRVEERHSLVTVTPEQPDDLWALRRVISKGDYVAGETSRVFKETAEYARPDKERIKVTVTLEVEGASLDSTLTRLKVSGKIIDVSNDLISKGSFHSLTVSEGHRVSIRKQKGFSPTELSILRSANAPGDSYAIVAIDTREAGIGIVKGTHLQILPSVESGVTGKMYFDPRAKKVSASVYFEKIAKELQVVATGCKVFVLGPSTTKNSLANYLSQNKGELGEIRSIDGSDVAGEDGVYVALRNPKLQEALGESRLAKVSKILAEVMKRISRPELTSKVAMSFNDTLRAAKQGAVESLLVSTKIFSQVEEDSLVQLLNSVEEYRGETFLLDSSTDLGGQVNSLGGSVALLRFALRS